jgi:hypothetical protein
MGGAPREEEKPMGTSAPLRMADEGVGTTGDGRRGHRHYLGRRMGAAALG